MNEGTIWWEMIKGITRKAFHKASCIILAKYNVIPDVLEFLEISNIFRNQWQKSRSFDLEDCAKSHTNNTGLTRCPSEKGNFTKDSRLFYSRQMNWLITPINDVYLTFLEHIEITIITSVFLLINYLLLILKLLFLKDYT
jgi:hypothetical protein